MDQRREETVMNKEQVREFFESKGFKKYKHPDPVHSVCEKELYQQKLDSCLFNANVSWFSLPHPFGWIEFNITIENPTGYCFKLVCYSVNPKDLNDETLGYVRAVAQAALGHATSADVHIQR
jgi:hypothetical protein